MAGKGMMEPPMGGRGVGQPAAGTTYTCNADGGGGGGGGGGGESRYIQCA